MLPPIPHKLFLELPDWAHPWRQLLRLFFITATPSGIYMLIAQIMNAPTADSVLQGTPNTVAFETSVLFATTSAICPVTVQTNIAPCAMTWDTSSWTVPSQRTLAAESFSTMETQRGSELAPVVQVFEGGIITVWGQDFLFSVIHLLLISLNSPLTFTVPVMFFMNTFQYTVW